MRRRAVVSGLLAAAVPTSGCTGFLSGPVAFSASKATVSDAALRDTGYEHARTEEQTVKRTFSAAGQRKDVKVTNWISEYHRSARLPSVGEREVAVFATFASPNVEVLGQSFNPLSRYDNRELAEQFTSRVERVGDLRTVSSRNMAVLGNSTEVTTFEASVTTKSGVTFEANLLVTKVEHAGDYVVALAVYPKRLSGEDERIGRLLEGIEHGE